MRTINIRRAVLEILEGAEPLALPECQMIMELNGRIRPPVGKAEFDDEIGFLQRRGFVTTVPDLLDEELVKWAITEAGKTMLRQ
jgi:hypothetical protein